jgi:hypothetical protein
MPVLARVHMRVAQGLHCIVVAVPQAASELYAKAVKALEAEGKASMSADVFRQAARRLSWSREADVQHLTMAHPSASAVCGQQARRADLDLKVTLFLQACNRQ